MLLSANRGSRPCSQRSRQPHLQTGLPSAVLCQAQLTHSLSTAALQVLGVLGTLVGRGGGDRVLPWWQGTGRPGAEDGLMECMAPH